MALPEIYVSIDIETDGPTPALNSMLSLGAAVFFGDGSVKEFATWSANLQTLPGTQPDPDTMAWWHKQSDEAREAARRNPFMPAVAMRDFANWVSELPGKPVAVAWPAAFDFAFVNYYCWKFIGRNPLGFACLDIRSYANGLAGAQKYYELSEPALRKMAGEIDKEGLRPHVAVDDAIEQGRLFVALRNYARTIDR